MSVPPVQRPQHGNPGTLVGPEQCVDSVEDHGFYTVTESGGKRIHRKGEKTEDPTGVGRHDR